ncbi:DUF2130 domain-containing protein [Spiroplasma endosymbiont of Othius punctulatus]|uniref:DUF2130 domain-containing protein n=1 Tax=Spiroplasma endosymbiont of Othius punctulatus TaxID=3066289 RepID=UPI0030CDEB56
MNKNMLTCPKCGQDISISDLFEHNTEAYNKMFQSKNEEYIKSEIKKRSNDFEEKLNTELRLNKFELESEFSKKQKALEDDLKQKNEKIISSLQMEKQTLEIKVRSLSEDKEKDFEIKIMKIESEWNSKLAKLETSKEKELLETKAELIKNHSKEVEELKIANATNKLIHVKTKGENFETEVELELIKVFGRDDEIKKITMGDTKADFLQVVKKDKVEIGKIVYEVKNAEWKDSWLSKLSEDIAKQKAKYGILIAVSAKAPFYKHPDFDNIWISDATSFSFVGQIIRQIIEVERRYFVLEKNLLDKKGTERLLVDLQKTRGELVEFMETKLPAIVKDVKKQLDNYDKVKYSLLKNANAIEQGNEKIKRKIFGSLIKELEKVSQINLVVEEEIN